MSVFEDRWASALRLSGIERGAVLLTSPEDVRWCCGFTGSNGWLLLQDSRATLLTDGRYTDQAANEVPSVVQVLECRTTRAMIDSLAVLAPDDLIAVQEEHLTVALWRNISTAIGERSTPANSELSNLRRSKSTTEMDKIRRAAKIADEALASCLELFRPGTTERGLRDALEIRMRELGADGPSYDTIIASGPSNSALPHHRPGTRAFENGETVVVDVGALVEGYHSDMTRTFFIGSPSNEVTEWYRILLEAQATATSLVAPGRAVKEIDAACRRVLATAGVEEWFTHGLGHGVGLQIHENPFISATSDAVLRPGDVVTIEPGLYRGGFAGMRIEDLILVTDDSHEILTSSPKDPICPR
ncbi:MAG: putative Xaa-Pro dipeptidase [Actinomycetota bacterium]|jgi:Xaa-Pro aminopeptidase